MFRLRDDEIGRAERKNGDVAPVHGLPGGVILSLRAPDSAGSGTAREVRP
jgi:hypothetical protein